MWEIIFLIFLWHFFTETGNFDNINANLLNIRSGMMNNDTAAGHSALESR